MSKTIQVSKVAIVAQRVSKDLFASTQTTGVAVWLFNISTATTKSVLSKPGGLSMGHLSEDEKRNRNRSKLDQAAL